MRILLVLLAASFLASAPAAQVLPAFDLATAQVVTIANGDLGSGRIVDAMQVTPGQRGALLRYREVAGAVEVVDEVYVVASKGFSLVGAPEQDGRVDCGQKTAVCFVVPEDPGALVVIVSAGAPAD